MKFDILGKPINLYYKSYDKMSSTFGGIMSITLVILCGILIFAFGKNFFERSNPKVALSTLSSKDYPINYIGNNNFTFAFRLETGSGAKYEDDSVFFFEFYWDKYYKLDNGQWNQTWGYINFTRCTKDHFIDKDFAERTDINEINCANFDNNTIGGFWDGSFIDTIVLNVIPCREGRTNPLTGTKCLPDSEKPTINWNYVSIFTQYNILDTTNYKPVIKPVIKNEYFTLDDRLKKINYLFFKEIEVISDYGWILENKIAERSLGISSSYIDVFSNLEFLTGSKLRQYYSHTILYGRRERDIITRYYDRIQTLTAEVGGIIKFIMIIFLFFTRNYSECSALLEISELLISQNIKCKSKLKEDFKSICINNDYLVNNVSLLF